MQECRAGKRKGKFPGLSVYGQKKKKEKQAATACNRARKNI